MVAPGPAHSWDSPQGSLSHTKGAHPLQPRACWLQVRHRPTSQVPYHGLAPIMVLLRGRVQHL